MQPHFFAKIADRTGKFGLCERDLISGTKVAATFFCINYAGNSGCNFGLGDDEQGLNKVLEDAEADDDSQADAESDNMAL